MEAKEKQERPEFVTDEHLEFLDALRESGVTNMYGATPYVQRAFRKLKGVQAQKVLSYWMRSFSERHPKAPPVSRRKGSRIPLG